ncbi:MAG: hypothetical protein RLZZ338_3230 [Cyanobacteriota bacterium]
MMVSQKNMAYDRYRSSQSVNYFFCNHRCKIYLVSKMKKTVLKGLTALVLAVVVALGLGVQATLAAGDVNLNLDSPLKVEAQADLNKFVDQFLAQINSRPFGVYNVVTYDNCNNSCKRLVQEKPEFLMQIDPMMSGSSCIHECYWNTGFWNKLRPNTRY